MSNPDPNTEPNPKRLLLVQSVKSLGLLTRKKMIYAANVADSDLATGNSMVEQLRSVAEKEGANVVVVSAQVEAELCDLSAEDRADFLER